jgi:hypothetical protein
MRICSQACVVSCLCCEQSITCVKQARADPCTHIRKLALTYMSAHAPAHMRCTHTHKPTHIFTHTHDACTHTNQLAYLHIHTMHAYTQTNLHMYTYTRFTYPHKPALSRICTKTNVHTPAPTHMYTHTHAHTHNSHVYTYARTHTHTSAWAWTVSYAEVRPFGEPNSV